MQVELFRGHNVRTEVKGNKVWFALQDVLDVLGSGRARDVVKWLKEGHRETFAVIDSLGRRQKMWFISERGLIRVLNSSNSSLAEPFQDWADERIEQLLRGKTVNASGAVENLSKLDILKMALEAEEKRLELEARNKELEPKAEVHDKVLDAGSSLGFRQVAATLKDDFPDLNEYELKRIMREDGLIYKKTVDSTAKARENGYVIDVALGTFSGKTRTQSRWTPKGIAYLIYLINNN